MSTIFPIAVAIPTLRRPESFARAVRSVFAQTGLPAGRRVQIILADNDPEGSALPVARQLAEQAPAWAEVTLLHEPEPGVANVRNRIVAVTRAPLLAFLDDDQSATPGWLAAFMEGQSRHPASVTFGPITTALPAHVTRFTRYFDAFFDRTGPAMSGHISHYYGCGNALLDLTRLPAARPLFDARANETGGEDDLLFEKVRAALGSFAWNAEALVAEHVPDNRARLGYTLRRAFAYGQGPTWKAAQAGPARWPLVPLYMLSGAVQALACGLAGAITYPLVSEFSAFCLDKASRGLGKLVWWSAFKQKFYGRASLPGTAAPHPGAEAAAEAGADAAAEETRPA